MEKLASSKRTSMVSYKLLHLQIEVYVLVTVLSKTFIRLKVKQTSHTSVQGFIGLLNSYSAQQSILPLLISGRLAVSLPSFSSARFGMIYFLFSLLKYSI